MSREALQVRTTHLRELAAKHGQAATEITSATEQIIGMADAVRSSHGVIAWSTADALATIEQLRRDTGNRLAFESALLSQKLTSAAEGYTATDRLSGTVVDQQIQPRTLGPR